MGAAMDGAPDQAGAFQGLHMLGGTGKTHAQGRCQLSDGLIPLCQAAQHVTARGIGQRAKDGIQSGSGDKFNHKVEYRPAPGDIQPLG
ncbi:hypothetical protein G6F58_013093 [Rhizopus delemar]|nr:hypothetical protein G6F58_013093 [Rhizopus delemar]